MKVIIILIAAYSVAGLVEGDPDLITEYAQTPKQRCLQAYEGSKKITQCQYL